MILDSYQNERKPHVEKLTDFTKELGKTICLTDPIEADEGTVRKLFAESKSKNAIHGSDSDENAQIESNFHFSSNELF